SEHVVLASHLHAAWAGPTGAPTNPRSNHVTMTHHLRYLQDIVGLTSVEVQVQLSALEKSHQEGCRDPLQVTREEENSVMGRLPFKWKSELKEDSGKNEILKNPSAISG
ncbi:hypothetical protein H8959_014873, partial [Pygathrix nigripes]